VPRLISGRAAERLDSVSQVVDRPAAVELDVSCLAEQRLDLGRVPADLVLLSRRRPVGVVGASRDTLDEDVHRG